MELTVNGDLMRRLIKEKFGSYEAFGDECGVSRQYVSRVVNGQDIPALERAVQFAALLGVSVEELFPKESALTLEAA